MPGCSTGRNIQKYKGAAASTLQDVTDNGNTTTGDLITTSGFFIGDGSLLTGIAGASSAFSFQDTSDRGNTTSNTIQFINTHTSLVTSGNIVVAGNVTATDFYGDGTTLTGITLSTDMTSNVIRISNLESNLTANSVRIGSLETDLTSNASRIGSLETDLTSNASRMGTAETNISSLETDVTSNTARVGSLETDLTSNASRITTVENNVLISNSSGITTGIGQGEILIGHLANQLSTLSLGADSEVLTCNTTSGRPEWKSASAIGTTVATLSNTAYIIGGAYNGGSAKTWSLKASTANSTDHIVIRDNSGNINVSALNVGGTSLTSTAWSGNSATATKLAATVNIGGVPFDGSTPISLAGVNATGNQNTTGNATTATRLAAAVDIGGVSFDGSAAIIPSSITNAPDTATATELSVAFINNNQVKTNTNLTFKPSTNELKLTDLKITGALTAGNSKGNIGQVLKSTGSGVEWGTDNTSGSGSGSSVWLQSGSTPNYIVTTPTPQSNVGISNTYEVKHTLHIGSNVIVSDTGGHDVLRVNGNVFCTNYLFGDGSKIRNLNTIRTETGANQISVGSEDGGPVLSWRDRQIRYQYGADDRPVPAGYGF